MHSIPTYEVFIDGQPVEVMLTSAAAVVRPLPAQRAQIEVRTNLAIDTVDIRPKRLGLVPAITKHTLNFEIATATKLSVEINSDLTYPLLILSDVAMEKPEKSERVIVLEAGEHDAAGIKLGNDSTLYLCHGARVKGPLLLDGLKNIQILGTGIIDAVPADGKKCGKPLVFDQCENVFVSGPLLFMRGEWGCIVRRSRHVEIQNLKLIGHDICSDGIDVDGSHHVKVSGCYIKNNDDCLCVKSSPLAEGASVLDVEFSNCILWNGPGGNGIDVGYESQTDSFKDIVFRDIDIVHVENEPRGGWVDRQAGLSMHITHDAHVENVLFENITLEDVQAPKMIQFLVFHYYREHGWFSPPDRFGRGRISNVRLKNVHFLKSRLPRVHIEGHKTLTDIQDVTFENVTLEGINLKDRKDVVFEIVNTRDFRIL
jgi:Glycosyl hydrolases family 28